MFLAIRPHWRNIKNMTSPSRTIAAAIPTLSARDGSIERELNKNTIEFVYSVQPHTDLNNHGCRIPYSV